MAVEKGECRVCYDNVRLRDQRAVDHARPATTVAYSGYCTGSGQVALDELAAAQETLVDLLGRTIDFANTAHMSEKNRRRCALAVYWTLRGRGLVW